MNIFLASRQRHAVDLDENVSALPHPRTAITQTLGSTTPDPTDSPEHVLPWYSRCLFLLC